MAAVRTAPIALTSDADIQILIDGQWCKSGRHAMQLALGLLVRDAVSEQLHFTTGGIPH
ncbi:hypothetical protein [Nocardioides glacieisoli]|jgi:hypothetical protein|uniref:hypothetical protein n=1 Tax=Nocardioides glacieisoli TaxID=1168730 RepID=UPI0013ED089E|nr:hypothetical protein [Nocardioides glacieisoli]